MLSIVTAVLSGTLIFVIGQIVLKLFIEPWQRQRDCISNVAYMLYLNRQVYTTAETVETSYQKASMETRQLAADLLASYERIPFYSVLALLKLSPKAEVIREAVQHLTGLSNDLSGTMDCEKNARKCEKVEELLNINSLIDR